MATIPKRVEDRLVAGLKKFQTVLTAAKSREVNESVLTINTTTSFAAPPFVAP